MAYNKGLHGSSSHRGKPYALMLLIAFGAALLGVMVLHKLRERRIYNLLVKEKDNQLLSLQLLLQKERDRTKELTDKNKEMKGKIYALRIQKMELDRRVVEIQSTMDSLRDEQKVMESAFEEKQNEFRTMEAKGVGLVEEGSELTALRENLKQKEAEIQELKHRLEIPVTTMIPMTGNGTIAVQYQIENENKEKEQDHSLDTARHEGDDKHNMDASKSKPTMFKDGEATVGAKYEIQNDEKPLHKREGTEYDDGEGATSEANEVEVVEDKEKKQIREEQPEEPENNTDAGEEYSKVRQWASDSGAAVGGAKRKHGRLSRTNGRRRKTIVKNKLMENNYISERRAEMNMGNRNVYRKEKGDLKSRKMRRVSDEDNATRENQGWGNNNIREDKLQRKLLKPDNHETNYGRNMIANDKNHEVTNNDINIRIHQEKEKLGEIWHTEKNEDSIVDQNWSRRHISKAEKDGGHSKSDAFHEETEEIEVSGVQKKEKFVNEGDDEEEKFVHENENDEEEEDNDDFFKDPQSNVEDEKEEYKEEIDESEFQPNL